MLTDGDFVANTLCWLAYLPAYTVQPSAVGVQRCRTIHRRPSKLRPHHRHTRHLPLVEIESPGACSVHAGDNPLSFTEWRWRNTSWLQTCDVCLPCRQVCVTTHDPSISSMSASRSAQLLETDRSLWLVLDYGTVCHLILLRATRCRGSVENSRQFYLDIHIPLCSVFR